MTGQNLYDPNTVVSGQVLLSDGSIAQSSDLFASDFIPIVEGQRYVVTPQISSSVYGAAFYDIDKTFISSMQLNGSGTNGLYPLVFVAPEGSAYFRFSIWKTRIGDARLYKYSAEAFKKLLPQIPVAGCPIALNPTVNIRKAFTTGLSSRQGGAVYNGKFLSVNADLTSNYLIDLITGEQTAVSLSGESITIHANTVCFGNVFYDNSDAFPVVYISGEGQPGFCGVFRITESNDTYSIALLAKINYPATTEQYFNLLIDTERDLMYLRGYLPGSDSSYKGFVKYELLKTFTEDITLEYVEKSEEHPYGYIDYVRYYPRFVSGTATQDSFIRGGRYYGAMGGADYTACLNVIDMESGRLLSFIDLTQYTAREVESCALYDDSILFMTRNGEIHIVVPTK